MKKKLISMIVLMLVLSVPVSTLAASEEKTVGKNEIFEVQALDQQSLDEINAEYEKLGLFDHELLYSGPIGGDENLVKPTEPTDGNGTNELITDGPEFNWVYDETEIGNDKLVVDGWDWLASALLFGFGGGLAYNLTKKMSTEAGKYIGRVMAVGLWTKGVNKLPDDRYTYWEVDIYTDEDAYNIYTKFNVRMYHDRYHTIPYQSWSEVHSDRIR